jgi:hypothetical protein
MVQLRKASIPVAQTYVIVIIVAITYFYDERVT